MSDDIKYLTWDGDPANNVAPHRPSIAHLGDNDKENEPGFPPDPRYGITADGSNQRAWQLWALSKVVPAVKLSIRFDGGGAPYLHSVSGTMSEVSIVPGESFTVTDNGTGDTTISWSSDFMPPILTEPEACINGLTPGMISVQAGTQNVRVLTLSSAGAATNLPFTVSISGG